MDEVSKIEDFVQRDSWTSLKQYTAARIALGRTGVSLPLQKSLDFKLAHAQARDAVYAPLEKAQLIAVLEQLQFKVASLHSQSVSREEYLQRPDLGRRLNKLSVNTIMNLQVQTGYDLAFILADGLSSTAINQHAVPVLQHVMKLLNKFELQIAPITLVEQGRVAISDEIGSLLKAKAAVIFIGERPGLSSPDSLGVYLTYQPSPGLTDHARNCISNIRPEGLPYPAAAEKIVWLITESLKREISGVSLKENLRDLNRLTE